jgi:hypothetical protein
MDLALPFQLLLLLVFVGEGVFHLFEANVVHASGIDVASDQPGVGGAGEPDGHLDGGVGVVRIIEGDVDLLVHRQLSLLERRDALT